MKHTAPIGDDHVKKLKKQVKLLSTALASCNVLTKAEIASIGATLKTDKAVSDIVQQRLLDMHPVPPAVQNTYVLGFAFDASFKHVLLVFKNRPSWQQGKLNGVGGHLEVGECPLSAMVREFKEETGIQTDVHDWYYTGRRYRKALTDNQPGSFKMHIFATIMDTSKMKAASTAKSPTDEDVICLPLNLQILKSRGVPGLAGLVELASRAISEWYTFDIIDPVIHASDGDE